MDAFEGKRKFAGVRNVRRITEDLVYLGVSDRRLSLFENVYPVPRGVSYNSYLLLDERPCSSIPWIAPWPGSSSRTWPGP